ncbi:uncharacterized protein CCOS01_10474 [Colletotrichum costaricense]|uniref:Uncharacterized protein n=1 Tax=Colletotrichum costaricense TaxID=1209916 RepID=A0AAJ0DY77_9PEZI|nr:uncharacterized protein CCOS01_10474 [Colletotrichum costaricense]KAK1520355.1 hypothetical protein CCOS01_10474 [Colletotrichum costaricense]
MEFIVIVHPDQRRSARLKKQAHAHAARVTHARLRKRQVARHGNQDPDIQVKSQEERVSRPQQDVVELQHLVEPSIPSTIPGAFEHEPLASFLKSSTAEEKMLFSYYGQVIVPNMDSQCPILCYLGENFDHIRRNWLLCGSTDIDLLQGFLLAASRHLSLFHGEQWGNWAAKFKLRHISDLRRALSSDDILLRRTGVAKALVLSFDEIMLCDMHMASKHVRGAITIIRDSGGIDALGLSEIVRCVLFSCMFGKGLLDGQPLFELSPAPLSTSH